METLGESTSWSFYRASACPTPCPWVSFCLGMPKLPPIWGDNLRGHKQGFLTFLSILLYLVTSR